jgi:hypothetical protein
LDKAGAAILSTWPMAPRARAGMLSQTDEADQKLRMEVFLVSRS